MKKVNIKKILSYVVVMLILLSTFPTSVNAVKVKENDEYKEGKTLRPISIMFNLDEVLKWEKGKSPDDNFDRASVPLRERFTGHVVNPLASDKAKIQSVPLMNSKNDEDNSVNGDEFDCFAFDYWQYVDQMVFWDGPIPTADIIDAGHRNGVPVYGTLFFNWSGSRYDQKILMDFLKSEVVDGQKTYPVADKLIEMVKYYGFDGYFINQETSMYEPWGKEMRDFMLYAQRKAQEQGGRIRFSWYDAMANNGNRYHQNSVNAINNYFVKKYDENGQEDENGQYASDEFFMNFNWSSYSINGAVENMNKYNRNPFDAYAGFELQQNSYNTGIRYNNLLGNDNKLKVSIGLYTPDSIRGLAKNPEDYHEQERNFWVGFDGDPTTSGDSNSKGKAWRGIARFVADKSAVMEMPFNTYFNTGHGKKWFIDGNLSKDDEWNSRGVQDILPTWRWWIRSNYDKTLTARYDFDDAYNSGNSIKFEGEIAEGKENIAKLYSTRLNLSENSKLRVAYRGGKGSKVSIGLAMAEDYSDESIVWIPLEEDNGFWRITDANLKNLAGKTAYAIALKVDGTENKSDYSFNLGQIALYDDDTKPEQVTDVKIDEAMFRTSKSAEARMSWQPVDDAEYYEVYQETANGDMSIINATSSKYFYAEHINRTSDMEGTTQKLYVVAVGKNGLKSDPAEVVLDWKMLADDTENIPKKSTNVCLNAEITGFSGQNKSEPARNAINGTVNGNTDKWCVAGAISGWMSIDLGEPKTIRRATLYHAEAGGEGDTMNTRNFSIQYKDGSGNWQVAHRVSGNTQAVTDFDLEQPITAREWKLNITKSDTSPWTAIRIYDWQMFEQPISNKTNHIPMRWAEAKNTSGNLYQVSFKNVPQNVSIKLYKDKDLQNLITEKTATNNGETLIFDDVTLESTEGYGKIYYTSQAEGMDESIRMTLVYEKKEKLSSIKLLELPTKTTYAYGTDFDPAGGKVELTYDDGTTQVINLSEDMVKGYNPEVTGEQELTVEYKGLTADQTFTVTVKKENAEKVIKLLQIVGQAKTDYTKGEDLDLSNGFVRVTYDDDEVEDIALADPKVSVTGYDAETVGEQTLTVTYKENELDWKVTVNEPNQINKEKLQETIGQAELIKENDFYQTADEDLKESLQTAIDAAKVVEQDEEADQLAVANATVDLLNSMKLFMDKVVKSVEISTIPLQNKYEFGEELSLEGGFIKVTFGNDRQEDMAMTDDMISDYNPEKSGLQKVKVVYQGLEAGQFEVEVEEEEIVNPMIEELKQAITRAEQMKSTETYENASDLAKTALNQAIKNAEILLAAGAEDSLIKQAMAEIDEAIYDLSKPIEILVPYIPKETSESSIPSDSNTFSKNQASKNTVEVKIDDEKIALSSAEAVLARTINDNLTDDTDKKLVEKLVAKKISNQEFIQQISDKALVEYAKNVNAVFSDETKDHWNAKEMSAIRILGIIKGYPDGTFGGNRMVTGKEFIAMLVRLGNWKLEEVTGDWFAPYQKTAEEAGLLKDVDIDLSKELNREEVAFLAYKYLNVVANKELKTDNAMTFIDKDTISDKYQSAISYLAGKEILKGYVEGDYRPMNLVQRQEIVAILYRLLHNK